MWTSCTVSRPRPSCFGCRCRKYSSYNLTQRLLDRQEACPDGLGHGLLSAAFIAPNNTLSERNRPVRTCAQTVWRTGVPLAIAEFHMLARISTRVFSRERSTLRQAYFHQSRNRALSSFSETAEDGNLPCSIQCLLFRSAQNRTTSFTMLLREQSLGSLGPINQPMIDR